MMGSEKVSKEEIMALAGVAQLVGVLSYTLKGHRFDSRLGHVHTQGAGSVPSWSKYGRHPTDVSFSLKAMNKNGLEPWLVWLGRLSIGLQTESVLVQLPVRARAWVAGEVPGSGRVRGKQFDVSPLLFLPPLF